MYPIGVDAMSASDRTRGHKQAVERKFWFRLNIVLAFALAGMLIIFNLLSTNGFCCENSNTSAVTQNAEENF